MALKPLQYGMQPIGQYDGLDHDVLLVKGGEVVTFTYVSTTGTDISAPDADTDGYTNATSLTRPAVTYTLTSGVRPLFLVDDGTTFYGTLFGSVVGATAGQQVTGGANLGPHTATGSGKLTLWSQPGLFAVSLDAADTTHPTGLVVGNATLTGNTALYATTAGLLTPDATKAFEAVVVARFIEFQTNGSLVTTPRHLVQALNSPVGLAGVAASLTWAHIYFHVED